MQYTINKNGRQAVINCGGTFTFNDHEVFRDLLATLSGVTDIDTIMFDLNDLNFLDSAGIGMLIIANDEADLRKQQMALQGAKDQVKMAIETADLKSLLTIVD